LEKDVEHWKTRFEVAQAFIELSREQERRQEKKKKRLETSKGASGGVAATGDKARLAPVDDGRGAGHPEAEPGEVGKEA
jgi:hypothetical protein